MKKRFAFLMLFLSILTVFSSCKKDKENDEEEDNTQKSKSYLVIDKTSYELDKAYVAASEWSDENYLNLYLFSSQVTYNSFMGGFMGTGAGIKMAFDFSTPTIVLPEGTYVYIEDGDVSFEGKTFSECQFASNVNWWMAMGGLRSLKSGTVSVIKSGTIYTIEFSGTDAFGREIKCYYEGIINELESVLNTF
ncbi:MAG: hypothetical protein LBR52_04850 [Prevotellaceae bacterium]|jgi:hypothetical protein|nr:hypothetical protein [Prevotellaceae bacterium]